MFKLNKLALSVASSVALSAIFTISAAIAQTPNADEDLERIQITGSRIKRTDVETSVPIAVISRQEIVELGALNVAEVLQYSPVTLAANNQSNTTFTLGSVGLNTTELRNLEQERTLVLVNGRRFVSGVSPAVGYAVDLNSIPTALIERIEILKSASSAVYGTDAVAGVVNIITRQDFEGVEVNTQAGMSSESDRERASVNITAGGAWDDGNAWVSVGWDDDNGLNSRDRDFSALDQAIVIDDAGNEVIANIFSSFPPQGRISIPGGPSFNGDGTPFSFAQSPLEEGGNRFNRADFRQLVVPIERKYAASGINYDISSNVTLFSEVNWNSTKSRDSTIEPTPFDIGADAFFTDRGGVFDLQLDNPLLPQALVDNLVANGVVSFNDNGNGAPLTFVRRMLEFGARSTNLERDTIRIATGIDWNIDDNWLLNTYLSWGKTDQRQENGGQVNIERLVTALDVEDDGFGGLQCADELARLQGCAPADLFGINSLSPEAVDYIAVPATVVGQTEQLVFATTLTGDMPIELSGGAIGFAVGYEFREEKGTFTPGPFAAVGASSTNRQFATDGSFDTNDVFVEAFVPVLENLSFDLAARYTEHSVVGGNTTWNLGIEYSPIESVMLRASAATAIRTPNIANLFAGQSETFATVTDPCNNLSPGDTGNIAENCFSIQEISDRVARDGIFALTQVEAQSTGGFTGGNPDVLEETAETYSLGVVWQATDDLAFTIDYYNIEIDDAITTTSRTVVLQRCFEVSPGEFDATCNGQARRDRNGALTGVDSGASNENILETSGVDLEIAYNSELFDGNINASFIYTYINDYTLTSIETGSEQILDGQLDNPDHRATARVSYSWDDWSVAWIARYWGSGTDSNVDANFNFTDFAPLEASNNIGSVTYHNLNVAYAFDDGINVALVVNNLFDKQPPFLGQGFNLGATGINTFPEAYDVTGRYFQLNTTFRF
jgi:outer membrane receptor protein involved in Fe transport